MPYDGQEKGARRGVAGLWVMLSLSGVAAAERPRPVQLSWVRLAGAQSCPADAPLAAEVTRRLGWEPFATDAPRLIEGVFTRDGGRWGATVFVRDATGALIGSRQIDSDAPECDALADAAALVVALIIDPHARFSPKAAAPPPPVPPLPPAAAVPSASLDGFVRIGVRGLALRGALPGLASGAALAVDVGRAPRWGWGIGLRVLPEQRTESGDAGFGLTAGWLAGCAHAHGRRFGARGCVAASGGVIHSVVHEQALEPAQPGERLWLGAVASLVASYRMWGPVGLDLGTEIIAPVMRHRFWIEPRTAAAFQQSPIIIGGFLGLTIEYE